MLTLENFRNKSKVTQSRQKERNNKIRAEMCDEENRVEKTSEVKQVP